MKIHHQRHHQSIDDEEVQRVWRILSRKEIREEVREKASCLRCHNKQISQTKILDH